MIVGQRPDDSERSQGLAQRQQASLVLEQHNGPRGHLARRRSMFRAEKHSALAGFIGVRALEQSHSEFDPQHAPHRLIQSGHRELAFFDELRHVLAVETTHHLHVHAGVERIPCGFGLIGGEPVGDEFLDGRVIAQDEAVEFPLAAQNGRQREGIGRGRNAAEIVEGAHDRAHARLDGRLEGRKINLPQRSFGHIGRVVIASAFGRAIADEVFGAGEDSI